MTTDNFCFYLQNRLIQTNQTEGKRYSDTSPFSIPCLNYNIYLNDLNVVHFSTPVFIRHLWLLKAVVFLHMCLLRACCSIICLWLLIGMLTVKEMMKRGGGLHECVRKRKRERG